MLNRYQIITNHFITSFSPSQGKHFNCSWIGNVILYWLIFLPIECMRFWFTYLFFSPKIWHYHFDSMHATTPSENKFTWKWRFTTQFHVTFQLEISIEIYRKCNKKKLIDTKCPGKHQQYFGKLNDFFFQLYSISIKMLIKQLTSCSTDKFIFLNQTKLKCGFVECWVCAWVLNLFAD